MNATTTKKSVRWAFEEAKRVVDPGRDAWHESMDRLQEEDVRDDERRKHERAAAEGDKAAEARLNREDAREGAGVIGFLLELKGKQIWIEGVRINYRGVLREVLRNSDGTPGALVLFPFQRVSYFERAGPNQGYTYDHAKPHMVPYEVIHDVGEDGFKGTDWGKLS